MSIISKRMSLRTIQKKANEHGFSFQKGYQRYIYDGWGFVKDEEGNKIVGYQILDNTTGIPVGSLYNRLWDHELDFEEAIDLLKNLCR